MDKSDMNNKCVLDSLKEMAIKSSNDIFKHRVFVNAIDLIHRLQSENGKQVRMRCDMQRKFDDLQSLCTEQKAEIERLTEEKAKSAETAVEVLEQNIELQKQVDELKESANGSLLTSLYKKQADDHKRAISVQRTHWEKKVQQAVKDTAKEILDELDLFFKGTTFRKGYEFKKIEQKLKEIAKEKGVKLDNGN